ncbi:GNAT family N-acetyltransferase [Isachenkonia alkalipeptolytica]|uniref:GNAT family N-acetyltransferase n=1 Tax=Isachenkonia alkalipeptolytica TaxID=2565777 RepID=A0AA43XL43_9CLOT|nr:GNAT family N-acetyltransferase [Isachenkonia alkalipeptolytica]NBG87860.1 GNAT family N-acetyltransferase [Isachenkonia alkalipeptolytica]
MNVKSIRAHPELKDRAISYFQQKWASESSKMVYEDCINHSINPESPLPHWYLLMEKEKIIGCAGLITNDFISRMDLYPWICAIFVEEDYRGHGYGSLLMEAAKQDAKARDFRHLYLCTGHVGYYEKYGFEYIATGYHPWGDDSRIYRISL